jgi:hypothetical protein
LINLVHLQDSISDEKIKLCSLRDVSQQRRSHRFDYAIYRTTAASTGHCDIGNLPSTATVLIAMVVIEHPI